MRQSYKVNKVLFAMEKYCDADPKYGPTNSESMLVGAIQSTGLVGEMKHFYFDQLCKELGRERMSELLLEDCEVFRPDLVIYSTLGGLLGFQLNPPNEALNEIRRQGIKILTCLWDTVGIEEEIKWRWLPFFDYTAIMDSSVGSRFSNNSRVIQAYSAIDPRDFYNRNLNRDIDVCFTGGVTPDRWPQRARYINFLAANGINVAARGGQRGNRLSWEDYAGLLNHSKISLNWSINSNGLSQLKGRVFETMACGAMLIEDNGTETQRFFEPDKDFIVFESPEDLLKKIRYYLAHDGERKAIAKSGCDKVTNIYNARNMWGYIFERMGFL